MNSTKTIEFIVEGRVQGVGFRYLTLLSAKNIGVDGFVQNDPGGSVSGKVQGNEEQLQAFIKQIQNGPPLSSVSDLKTQEVQETLENGFSIKR